MHDPKHLVAQGYDTISERYTRSLLREAGFVVQRACAETADEDGVAVTFLWVLARREVQEVAVR